MLKVAMKSAKTVLMVALTGYMVLTASASAQTKEVVIKAGSPIEVVTTTDITSKKHKVGSIVDLKLLNPIIVGGETVVPAGTIIKGKVTRSQKSKLLGKEGTIAIAANMLTAVDGTLVPISGISFEDTGKNRLGWSIAGTVCCLFGFLLHGGQGIIPAGTQMSGNVLANTAVTIGAAAE